MAYVVDASDVERMSEGWEIFGLSTPISRFLATSMMRSCKNTVLNHPSRNAEEAHRLGGRQVERRMASLNVMGVSAIEG